MVYLIDENNNVCAIHELWIASLMLLRQQNTRAKMFKSVFSHPSKIYIHVQVDDDSFHIT